MSKIVRAANAMLSKPELITQVTPSESEYYFLYNRKHKWSIRYAAEDDTYWLYYYSGEAPLAELAATTDWEDVPGFVGYSSKEIGTKEARATFAELFTLVREKAYDVDKALDEIIGGKDDDVPF